MSIKIMSNVWDQSDQKGAKLLLMLAVADYADEYAFAWPSIPTLAKKIRMSERHTRRLLQELEEDGELYIDRSGYSNRYVVTIGMSSADLCESLKARLEYEHDVAMRIAEDFFNEGDEKQEDKLSPCLPEKQEDTRAEHEDTGVRHEDTGVQHEDARAEHEDIDVPQTIMNHHEPSNESSSQPDAQARERARERASPPEIELDPNIAAFMSVWETEIGGTVTAYMLDEITDLVDTCPDIDKWRRAIRKAKHKAKYNPLQYAKAIIKNQQEESYGADRRGNGSGNSQATACPADQGPADGVDLPSADDIAAWFSAN